MNDRYPLDFDVVVVQAPNAATLDPIARSYLRRGGKLIAYLAPLARQTARITVSSSRLGAMLAADAAAWARDRLHGRATALYVAPEPAFLTTPFLAGLPAAEQAIRATLAGRRLGIPLTTVVGPGRAVDAVRTDPRTRIVLCGIDADAYLIAQMLRRGPRAPDPTGLYVGGLGSPTPYDAAVLAEVRRGGVLRAIVAARPRDLADALVDLPVALLRRHAPYDLEVVPRLLTPRSAALGAFQRDFALPVSSQANPLLDPITTHRQVRTTS